MVSEDTVSSNEAVKKKADKKLDGYDIATALIAGAVGGALGGGTVGCFGKWSLSFFNPGISSVGNFGTFAGVGAIAFPVVRLTNVISKHYMDKSEYLNAHPNFKSFLANAIDLVVRLAAVTAATAIVGSPIIPTVACIMLIPAIIDVLGMIASGVNAFLAANKESKSVEATPAPAMG